MDKIETIEQAIKVIEIYIAGKVIDSETNNEPLKDKPRLQGLMMPVNHYRILMPANVDPDFEYYTNEELIEFARKCQLKAFW